jgi:hypothetical protein
MKLPLLVEFRPLLDGYGPKVYFAEGEWEIETNHKDSILSVETQSSTFPLENGVRFFGPAICKVRVVIKGTETAISAYARRL